MSLDNVNKLLIGNIPSGLSDVISFNIDRALNGETSQFIYGLDAYLTADKVSKKYYLDKGKASILKILENNPKAKISEDAIGNLSDTYFIFNGALEDGVMIGFDMEKEGCPRALYTRNFDVIRGLASMGCISNFDKLDKAEQSVKGTKTVNGLKNIEEALIGVARLDFEGIINGKKMYKVVVPQQGLRVGLNNPILMTPFKAMYILASKLDYLFNTSIVRFTETTGLGVKQGIVSANANIVKNVYSPKNIDKKLSLIESGYNYNLLRYFTYDLESSIYSKGYATFRPEMLDRLEVVTNKDIDKSRHNIDFRLLRKIYEDKIKSLSKSDMYAIRFFDLSNVDTSDRVLALLNYGDDLDSSELYTVMKQNPSIFGDIIKELSIAESKVPQIVKDLKVVNIPNVMHFKGMLDTGLVKVTTSTKKGRVIEVYGTNNKDILSKILGSDYIKDLESPRHKYNEFKNILKSNNSISKDELDKLALKYDVDMSIIAKNSSSTSINVDNIISDIDNHLDSLLSKRKKALSPTMVTLRNIYAKESKDFYITIDVSQIKQIEYAAIV